MTDYKQLCAELLDELKNAIRVVYREDGTRHISSADPVIAKADAALAEPEPKGPTDAEFLQMAADSLGYQSISFCDEVQACGVELISFARAILVRWGRPAPQPGEGEVTDVVRWLRSRAGIPGSPDFPAVAAYLTRAADLLERLDRYDQALSAVMPSDFKDWWENSKDEWPDVAAGVIQNLRQREELAWEQVERLSLSWGP